MPDPLSFATVTNRFGLPLLFPAQAYKELFHNEALARIDAVMHATVLGEQDTPPISPKANECWLIGSAPTGAWADHPAAVTLFQGGEWIFIDPIPGMRVFNRSSRQFTLFCDEWQKPDAFTEPTGGLHVDAEARVAIRAIVSALKAAGVYPAA